MSICMYMWVGAEMDVHIFLESNEPSQGWLNLCISSSTYKMWCFGMRFVFLFETKQNICMANFAIKSFALWCKHLSWIHPRLVFPVRAPQIAHSPSQLIQTPAGSNFEGTLPAPFCHGDINLLSWWWTQSLASLLTHFLSYHLLAEWSVPHAGRGLPEETNVKTKKVKERTTTCIREAEKKGDAGFYSKVTFSITVAQDGMRLNGIRAHGRCINI